MYIEEISLEGFKSYATSVRLSNLDPNFNAITGLNGSGKSNVLDSICFVMGINKLAAVRVSSNQELVYKQGQAGVTKATVSITFVNDRKKDGPAGYEEMDRIMVTRQIAVGGRSKYLINGRNAAPGKVQDLFMSVQLNVNNPHFLIMQGMITKVCNMKPPEILSLLEEACGTRMFEKKKENALKIVEKKQAKLNEIDNVLECELRPSLEKLKEKQKAAFEFQVLSSECEQTKRFVAAFDWKTCKEQLAMYEQSVKETAAHIEALEKEHQQVEQDLADKKSELEGLEAEKEIQAQGEMKELKKAAEVLQLQLTKDTTNWNNKKKDLEAEKKNLVQTNQSLQQLNEEGLQAAVAAATAERDAKQEQLAAAERAVEAATREVAGAEAGDGRDESNKSMQERLADAQNAKTAADGEAQAAQVKLKHLQKQAQQQRKELGSKQKEGGALQAELQAAQKALADSQQRMQALGYDAEAAGALRELRDKEAGEVQRLKREVDDLSSRIAGVDFRYSDPAPRFDRSKVKGVVAKLIKVQDPRHSLALEVAAGGKLYQVVVDTEETGKQLLEKGQLRNRVTIIPLNKVKYSEMPDRAKQTAHKLVGTQAAPALELVGYSEEVSAALKYTFGNVFICEEQGSAKKLAFSREVGVRSVTLEGDDFNPSGLLTGGSQKGRGTVLSQLHQLMELEEQLAAHGAALATADQQLQSLANAAASYNRLKQQMDLKEHQVSLLKERLALSEAAQLAVALAATEEELAAGEEALRAAQAKKQEMVALAQQLEHDIANYSRDKDRHVAASKAKLKAAKADLEKAKKALNTAEKKLHEATAELEAAGDVRQTLQEQITAAEQSIAGLETEVLSLAQKVEAAKAQHDAAAQRLQQMKLRQSQCDQEIKAAHDAHSQLKKKLQDIASSHRKAQHQLAEHTDKRQEFVDHVMQLEKEHPWIEKEKDNFGHGEFDFTVRDPHEALQQVERMQERLKEMAKHGGAQLQVVSQLERVQKDFQDVSERREKVEKDKNLLKQTISELDKKKDEALKVTWQNVNQYFGNIFSTLLPGTQAKLEPPEGGTYLDGLEMKVAFGGVWKQSLTELSGGQRSLLALSLVLALCQNKPAPLYILDEVDSALDLNHTQNIGRMIKKYFPQSQFLVVSLKEGMFSNANVIYRTKFVDGVSTITRTVTQPSSKRQSDEPSGPPRVPLRENVNR